MYANQLRPELSAEHLSALAQTALPQWGGTVMDKTFETLIQQGRQVGLHEGLLAGLHEALSLGIELKFGAAGQDLLPRLKRVTDIAALRRLRQSLPGVGSLAEFGRLLAREGG